MPKDKDIQLLQIRIKRKLFKEIKEHKDEYYSHLNMSAFFLDMMIKRIEEDKKK